MKKKAVKLLSILLAAALLIGASVGGTLAWLSAKTEKVTNTFAVGKIEIELNETGAGAYKVVPGASQEKKPVVTVKEGSEKCYVYVSVENNLVINGSTVGTLDIDSAKWTVIKTEGTKTVYRYNDIVDAASAAVPCTVFTTVTYDDSITEQNIGQLATNIIVQAFAHQAGGNATESVADAAAIATLFATNS